MNMSLNFSVPTPLSYFASLVQSDTDFPVLEAAASLAQDEEPNLDVQQVLDDVARLLKRIKSRLPADADDLTRLAILTQVFYKEMGFGVNANDYYAPENSYLHEVLRTRRGGARVLLALSAPMLYVVAAHVLFISAGVFLPLIPLSHLLLAGPPSLASCTRDVYPDGWRMAAGPARPVPAST